MYIYKLVPLTTIVQSQCFKYTWVWICLDFHSLHSGICNLSWLQRL